MQHNTNTFVLQPSFLVGDRILFYIVAHTSLPFLFFSSSCLLLFIAIFWFCVCFILFFTHALDASLVDFL
ncbi:hypothetical protein EUGRSUZ_C01496 [Eucalyptus grandis]|uniref:Uncharacterized protein n=2 Tax=Eucalyptus grandis TaxID=71139 RepID=A0A059CQD0_EUCGR|nr:hypothetical protein EUGRSUZ_C01496 [Eucalyptus grandis]